MVKIKEEKRDLALSNCQIRGREYFEYEYLVDGVTDSTHYHSHKIGRTIMFLRFSYLYFFIWIWLIRKGVDFIPMTNISDFNC